MLNFEKYKDKVLEIRGSNHEVSVINGEPVACVCVCHLCEFENSDYCLEKFVDWLLAEYKEPAPKLTKREREFLECFNIMENKKIRRNRFGLSVNYGFEENDKISFAIYGKMFLFIKEGESWTFEELMKLEVEE